MKEGINTDAPAGCDPARGKSCCCMKHCCREFSDSTDSTQVLGEIVLASLGPALRWYLDYGYHELPPARALIVALSRGLLAEIERREGGQQ